jgi:hypothetical protein
MGREMPDPTTEHTEWIVQADLPPRQVEFARQPRSRHSVPIGITNADAGERERRLQDLFAFLSSVLAEKPVLLRSAGAVSVSATSEELARISKHPLVKRIEPNRRIQ